MAKPNTALLLTGGGARAAYQVGALKAIAEFYPRNLGIPFPILCGTSAGAINVTALACYASCFHLGVRKLEWVWRRFETHHIFDFHPGRLLWRLMYEGSAGLINPTPTTPFTCSTTRRCAACWISSSTITASTTTSSTAA